MGCNSSKAGKVGILEVSPKSKNASDTSIDPRQRRVKKKNKGSSHNSQDGNHRNDDDYLDPDRGFSATSKQSKHSDDSGLGVGSDGEVAGIITENSDPDAIQDVIKNFHQRDASDLTIVGIGCQIRGASADKERVDERRVLESLRLEGLISKPPTKASGGVAFEVVEDQAASNNPLGTLPPLGPRPPPRLAKLERRRKKKKIPRTREEIEQKLLEAQRRKEEREQAIRAKAKELAVGHQRTPAEQKAEELEEQRQKDMDAHETRKQQKLLLQMEKQRKREEHAARVRQRKLEMAALQASGDAGPDGGEAEVDDKPEVPRGVIQVAPQPESAFGYK